MLTRIKKLAKAAVQIHEIYKGSCDFELHSQLFFKFNFLHKGSIPLKKKRNFMKKFPKTAFMKSLFRNLTVFLVHMYF